MARASSYPPDASIPKWVSAPGAWPSAQARRAANPPGLLGKVWSRAFPSGVRRQASRVALETSIPTTVVAAVPTAPLPSSSRMRGRLGGVARGVASEVEEHRRPVRHLVREVGCLIRRMRLIRPPGCRLNDPGRVTCETPQTAADRAAKCLHTTPTVSVIHRG